MQQTIDNNNIPTQETNEEEHPQMLLYEACKEGDLEQVKQILEKPDLEADIEGTDNDNWKPLHHAIHGGNMEVIRYLVNEKGAILGSIIDTEEGHEAFMFAVTDGHLEVVKYIAENGGEDMMDKENDYDLRPLHLACLWGHFDIVKYLVEEQDVYTDAVDGRDGWTGLHYASLCGDLDIVRFLAEEHHVDAESTEVDGWTALHCAANTGHVEIVKYLLEQQEVDRDALVKNVDRNALHLAASEGCLDIVKYLVEEQGFDIDEVSSDDDTAYHLAAAYGQLDIVKYFIEERCAGDNEARFNMLFATNNNELTMYNIAVDRVELEDDYANQEVVDYLYSYVALLAVPSSDEDEEPCVKLNPELSEQQRKVTEESYRLLEDTAVHEVAYHIMGYLCLSDVKQL
jgi:ankyrin repeat protein